MARAVSSTPQRRRRASLATSPLPDEQLHRGQLPPHPIGLEQTVPSAAQSNELADEGRIPVSLLPRSWWL